MKTTSSCRTKMSGASCPIPAHASRECPRESRTHASSSETQVSCRDRRDRQARPARSLQRLRPFQTIPHVPRLRRAPSNFRRAPRRPADGRATRSCPVGAIDARKSRRRIEEERLASLFAPGVRPPGASNGRSACIFDDEAKENESEVAVNRLGIGPVLERKRADGVLKLRTSGMVSIKRQPRRETRAMRQAAIAASRSLDRVLAIPESSLRHDRSEPACPARRAASSGWSWQ